MPLQKITLYLVATTAAQQRPLPAQGEFPLLAISQQVYSSPAHL